MCSFGENERKLGHFNPKLGNFGEKIDKMDISSYNYQNN